MSEESETVRRSGKIDWTFAMLEMLVDPVLKAWVPKWIVEQYERKNPDFRALVKQFVSEDREDVLTNRALIRKVRRELLKRGRRKRRREAAARSGATDKGNEDYGRESTGESSGGGEGGADDPDEKGEKPGRMLQEPLGTMARVLVVKMRCGRRAQQKSGRARRRLRQHWLRM